MLTLTMATPAPPLAHAIGLLWHLSGAGQAANRNALSFSGFMTK